MVPLALAAAAFAVAALAGAQDATVTEEAGAVSCRDRDDLVLFLEQTAEAANDPTEVVAMALVLAVLKDRGRCRTLEKGTALKIHERDTASIAGRPVPIAQVSAGPGVRWWTLADHLEMRAP